MRTLLATALTLTVILLAGTARATTPGPECRQACAPRIAQDCGTPGLSGFSKCKRRLVRACKRTTPEIACTLGAPNQPGGTAGGSAGGGGSQGGLAARVTSALGNRFIEHGTDSFFSGGSITENDAMTLCESGQMHLTVTTITSTFGQFSNTFDSTEDFDGTWSVAVQSGAAILTLATGEPEPRRFAVEIDASGTIVIDGRTASVSDASGPCGGGNGTPGGGGAPGGDVVQQITQALANQFLSIEEDNIGFGHRVTAIVLCASGRYALEIDASAVPGVEVSTQGAWAVRLDGTSTVLELAGEGTQPTRTFTLGADAQGNLLLNDRPVGVGDPSVVAQVCPSL